MAAIWCSARTLVRSGGAGRRSMPIVDYETNFEFQYQVKVDKSSLTWFNGPPTDQQ
ncbi:hypothetical protein AB0D60_29700 [Streptomyces sp. NPDC048306]|uniref:hypothetical protein n=1 Tax=unclassified Streptomyces TaxID=2593676 RepID=UPI0033F8E382